MNQIEIPAAFYRGGTSKGVFFREEDLPAERAERDEIFLQVIGSPDPYGRQLNGMGGGISSLSKVVSVGPPTRDDADVDYTFGQVAVDRTEVDYSTNCGNLSSAVGPFAIDEGLVTPNVSDGIATVRLHNTNTSVVIHAQISVDGGKAAVVGDFEIQGVFGTGSRIQLDYLEPGGATTGKFLPAAGEVISALDVPEEGTITVSMADAATGMVFIAADDLGLTATESPEAIDGDAILIAKLDRIRRAAGVAMGLANRPEDVPLTNPRVGLLAAPREFIALDGATVTADSQDITVRVLSLKNIHRVSPLTSALCLAAAVKVEGSLPNRIAQANGGDLRIGTPSGVLPVGAEVAHQDGLWQAVSTRSYRTARRLMQGSVLIPKT
ncbi:MAG: PrpF family protein [Rhodospirillaceae bacterium]|jgi:2-methylaconitate isomerase|nr:PrpF family protein [Rhodospirillaceae bacterium]